MSDLRKHARITELGAPPSELESWHRVLMGTADLLDRWFAAGPVNYDLPWHYNETAITGFVLSAVWAASRDAIAIQDYRTVGKEEDEEPQGLVRPDLWLSMDGQSFRMEAKRSWVTTWGGDIQTQFRRKAEESSVAAFEQVRNVNESADWLGAILYLVPYIPGKQNLEVEKAIEDVLSVDFPAKKGWRGFRLDYYPEVEHPSRTGDEYRHPGLTILTNFRMR